jgi:pimeloyl-ACP methyl ester carboxylesterase
MGGRIAVWYAAAHPGSVRGLALLDSRLGEVPDRAAAWRASMVGKRHGRGYPTREAALAAFRFVPAERDVPPAVIANLAHHAVTERAPGEWTFRFDRAVLALDGDGGGDLTPMLARIRCPAAVMGGEASWIMSGEHLREIATALPGCRVETFPGGHHFLAAHPEPVGRALRRFLDGLP